MPPVQGRGRSGDWAAIYSRPRLPLHGEGCGARTSSSATKPTYYLTMALLDWAFACSLGASDYFPENLYSWFWQTVFLVVSVGDWELVFLVHHFVALKIVINNFKTHIKITFSRFKLCRCTNRTDKNENKNKPLLPPSPSVENGEKI